MEKNSPFICLTESHLKHEILEAEIHIKGMSIYRSDRSQRSGGGVVSYVRTDLAVSSDLKHSNSYCEALGLHIPQLKLALLTMYRPPKCPQFKFKESLKEVRDWLDSIEKEGKPTPTIFLSGDFNLGFLENWEAEQIEEIKGAVDTRKKEGKVVAAERAQAIMLVNFVEEHFLQQQIRESTRNEAILDLLFTSNKSLVLKCTQINNVNLTDHKTCIAQLSYDMNPQEKQEKKNFKTTKIPDYDTAGADEEDWIRAGKLLDMVKWEEVLADKKETESC